MAKKALDVLSKNSEERAKAQQVYAYNYRRLNGAVSGAWFSFGDEKMMKEALKDLAKTPYGQNMFANISPKMQLESSNFMAEDMAGFFISHENKIRVNTNRIKNQKPVALLFHELLHAKQSQLGEMQTKGYSAGQVMVRALLAEAEAEGWDRMHEVMHSAFSSYTPTKEAVLSFMQTDLVEKAKKSQGTLFDEAVFKNEDPIYRFQQLLKKNNGALYKSQKDFVGGEILTCINAFSNPYSNDKTASWKAIYTAQAMSYTLQSMQRGYLTVQGNLDGFYQHLDRLSEEYGLSRTDLTRLNLSQEEMKVYANLIEVGKKAGFRLAEQNAARGWIGARVLPYDLMEESRQGVRMLRDKARQN